MEQVNHPVHYNSYSIEVIDMMERIWGITPTITFCEMNAFKYRMRAGIKHDNPEEDLNKEAWYLVKAKALRDKLSPRPNPNVKPPLYRPPFHVTIEGTEAEVIREFRLEVEGGWLYETRSKIPISDPTNPGFNTAKNIFTEEELTIYLDLH